MDFRKANFILQFKKETPHSLLIAADTSKTNQPGYFLICANDNGD